MAPDPLTRRRPARAAAVVLVATVAAVPLLGAVDARLDTMLDAWRSCPGEALATLVSNLVGPVGVAVLVAVVLRSVWNGRPAPAEIVRILATLGAGVILVGELKEFLDRPRPGAEFAGPSGASFPSGHVGNTVLVGIAVLALWYGGAPRPVGRRGWILLAITATAIAAARVYGRRHWPSDVVGTAALALGIRSRRHAAPRFPVADGGRSGSVDGDRPGARGVHARNHPRHSGWHGGQPATAARADRFRLRVRRRSAPRHVVTGSIESATPRHLAPGSDGRGGARADRSGGRASSGSSSGRVWTMRHTLPPAGGSASR